MSVMNNTKTILGLLTGALAVLTAQAQVDLTITGSTAFRAITIDRTLSLFDTSSTNGNLVSSGGGSPNFLTIKGTMSGKVPSLGATPVTCRLSFSGSGSGMLAVNNLTPVSTLEVVGGTVNKVPDLALSDVFPASSTPPIADSAFERNVLGVIPFVFVRNNALSGIINITREQAILLFTASGTVGGFPGMPATYLGGASANPVYLVGRDSGSGTRIAVHKCIGFVSTPTLWATNGLGVYVQTNGLSSGSLVANNVRAKADAIGYMGLPDFGTITNYATSISYNGYAYSEPTVANGAYAIWSYEHIVNRAGGLSNNQKAVRDALINAITDPTYQSTPIYTNSFVRLNQMNVERGADGGPITSTIF